MKGNDDACVCCVEERETVLLGEFIVIDVMGALQCVVCLEGSLEKEWGILPCGHSSHYECLSQSLAINPRCPVCRVG